MQKVTIGLDQMFIEDVEGNEDVEYIELIEVLDSENVSDDLENKTQKAKVQSKITSFFTAKN